MNMQISNRAVYSFLLIVGLILTTTFIYAAVGLVPDVSNPGHDISLIRPPENCFSGFAGEKLLAWDGTKWICTTSSPGGTGSQWKDFASGIYYESGNVAIGISSSSSKLYVLGADLQDAIVGKNSNGNYGKLGTTSYGVYGGSLGLGSGVRGENINGNFGSLGTTSYGVHGFASGSGTGVKGENSNGNYGAFGGISSGVYGYSSNEYAGYFKGAVYFSRVIRLESQSSEPFPCDISQEGALYMKKREGLQICRFSSNQNTYSWWELKD